MTSSPAIKVTRSAKRRRDRRFAVNQPALVSASAVPDLVWTARIADVSRRGMLLVLDEAVQFEGEVCIQWEEEIHGTIRHREQVGREYRVGVELDGKQPTLLLNILAQQNELLATSAS